MPPQREWPVVEVRRTLDPDAAGLLIGEVTPAAEPTVTGATVARDADTGETVYAYLPLGGVAELRRTVLGIGYHGLARAKGSSNKSRNFGYSPRRPVYGREGCRYSGLADEDPEAHRELTRWAGRLEAMLTGIDPGIAAADAETMAAVDASWKFDESSLWTSGVINRSSRLPYHRDRFNFPTWSAMPVLRRHIEGGYLHVPEYGAVFACRDGWGVFFGGYRLVHGVTPMRTLRPDGYRISIVYYALAGMKDCHTAAEEAVYARKRRTEREREIARRILSREKLPRHGRGGGKQETVDPPSPAEAPIEP